VGVSLVSCLRDRLTATWVPIMSSYWYWYDHSMDAATLIRATRESAGLSQGALAARAGTSQPAVSRPDSDIDLLVDFDVRSRGLFPLAGLQDELTVLLGEKVEVVPEDALAPHVAKNALAEAVPL